AGGEFGEEHANQMRETISFASPNHGDTVLLDFGGIESATSSYLKRLLNPFFIPAGEPGGFEKELHPIIINVQHQDLREDLEDHLNGKRRVIILAEITQGRPAFKSLVGTLDGAAAETFVELRELKRSTAAQLYERHRGQTTNQTAWNNRLAHLVELRIARRTREGRFWIYQPTL
ncbi:MAG: hypothetical protein JWM16_3468, partial [Verrucomicrobiales bacterium]|nr:hypothetical protein [Verrucomicrobiales bacterium]